LESAHPNCHVMLDRKVMRRRSGIESQWMSGSPVSLALTRRALLWNANEILVPRGWLPLQYLSNIYYENNSSTAT